jgi:hypothetical protein
VVAHVDRGEVVVRGRRGCQGKSWKGRRGALARVELEEATVGQSGGRRGWCSVDRDVVVGIGTARGGVEAGCEWKTKVERGSSSVGCSF